MKSQPVDLSVVLVTHNHAPYLPACLDPLRAAMSSLNMEIVVVDNVSTDASARLVREHLPAARLEKNTTRRGFAANANHGIRLSRGHFILLLNPDTEASADALETMMDFMRGHPDVGICGPQMRFPDGRVQNSFRRFPSIGSTLARRTPLRRWLRNSRLNRRHLMAEVDPDATQDVDWMLGACLMTCREAIDDVGLLDEGFFLYVEDIDWCYRMKRAGWRVVYLPTARVVHHHLSVTDQRWLTRRTIWHFRGMTRFVRKHGLRLQVPSGTPQRKNSAS